MNTLYRGVFVMFGFGMFGFGQGKVKIVPPTFQAGLGNLK